jgi:hypothetical protein
MKKYLRTCIATALLLAAYAGLFAQGAPAKPAKSSTAKKAPPTVEGKAITVTLKNLAEADISIFAGKREDLKTGQLKNFGGLSKNTLYIKENDVVCIMKDKKPVSCADVKPGTTALEVNSSANVITRK